MTSAQTAAAVVFLVFGGGAFLGVRLLEFVVKLRGADGARVAPFDDRLVGALAVVSGIVGTYNLTQSVTLPSLVLIGLVCVVLDYACCADLRAGRVPVWIGLPIALVAAAMDAANHDLTSVAAGALIAMPFAFAAFSTKGRAGGFGDAAIAALGGFVLGAELGILAVAVSCFAAAASGFVMKRPGGTVPFAPFLAFALQVALLVPAARALGT